MTGHDVDVAAAQKPTRGGSSEIEKNEPTAKPTGSRWIEMAVMTATPVGKCPKTRRKWGGLMLAAGVASGRNGLILAMAMA